MYISVKPVHFTDDELEVIYTYLELVITQELKKFYPEADTDGETDRQLELAGSALDKIQAAGIFN